MDFTPFSETRIALFIFDPFMKQHVAETLKQLGFQNVTDQATPRNYFEALGRLAPAIAGDAELVLINLPPKPLPAGRKNDVDPVFEQIHSLYLDLKTHLAKRSSEPLKLLSKTVPLIEVGDYLRDKLIEVLFKFRVPAAFFLSALPPTRHLTGTRKEQQLRDNYETHFRETSLYLGQYFRDREELVALADEKLSEKELTERKKKYDQLTAQAQERKNSGDYDSAINLLRQAIEVFPKDIEAYLESGRLYTRRREYGRALHRFGQAADLFQEAPAPNREIGNLRLTQAKEMIASGADPNSKEIKELLDDAVANFEQSHGKAVEMESRYQGDPRFEPTAAVGQEILKWNPAAFLGPKHPAVKALMGVVQKSTAGLDQTPLDQLATGQLLSLGLLALEERDIAQARKYYFQALEDKERFTEVCTEINYLGIRLRNMGLMDEAIGVYDRLLKYRPHNQGSVYWNLAVAHSSKKNTLAAAGYGARCLYTDPYIAREKEFYDSLSPQLAAVVIRLMKALRMVVTQAKKIQPPPDLIKLYQARDRLVGLIAENKNTEALKLFLALARQAPRFIAKPEFHGDGLVVKYLEQIKPTLSQNPNPAFQAGLKIVNSYLKYVTDHPAPTPLVRFHKLAQSALLAISQRGDQNQASFFLGQALLLPPEAYFEQPDFFARETLPALARELAGKFQYVDVRRFPKSKAAAPSSAAPKSAIPTAPRNKA
ncbi:MAG: tetratricopeptide repeat protein [Thermodesulfobacteriota bacterium]